jgi:hypothetical protein
MSKLVRSRVIRPAEAQAAIRAPQASTQLALHPPVARTQQLRTRRTRSTSLSAAEVSCCTTAAAIPSSQGTFCAWVRERSIVLRTLLTTLLCGLCSTALAVAKSPHRGTEIGRSLTIKAYLVDKSRYAAISSTCFRWFRSWPPMVSTMVWSVM